MGNRTSNSVHAQDEKLPRGKMMFNGRGCIIYTAGSCIKGPNGLQAGIGVYWPDEPLNNISVPLLGQQTSQRAELMAVIIGINEARLLSYNVVTVCVGTNADYIKNAVERSIEEWERSGWKEPKENKQEYIDLRESMKRINVYFERVKIQRNLVARSLALQAAKESLAPLDR